MIRLPIRARLTLISAALMATVLGLAGLVLYALFATDLRHAVDEGLRSRAQTLLAGIGSEGDGFADPGSVIDPDEAFAQILGRDGSILESTTGLPSRPLLDAALLRPLTAPRAFTRVLRIEGEPTEARLLAAPSPEGPIVLVGASLENQRLALARLRILLLAGIPIAVGVTTLVGWLLAGAALRPVDRMAREAAAIPADDLGRRLSVPDRGDEVTNLGRTLNALLERIRDSVQRERRFVDDASHELRTPLANLKTELEVALRGPRSAEELRAALASATAETDRLIRLAEDLLILARTEQGRLPIRRVRTDLGELADRVIASFEATAAGAGTTIHRTGSGAVAAVDPTRLQQVLGNLLDNALRHGRPGGTVEVQVDDEEAHVRISVLDDGPGFAPSFLQRAFDPFASGDPARSRSSGGSGLGLAIVRSIVEAHGGTVEAANRPEGGAVVTLTLPAGPAG